MKLYIAKSSDFCGLPGLELLSISRREKLEKYNKEEDKQRCLAAGLLLHYVLGEDVNNIAYMEKGKPHLPQGVHLSISHSGDYAVLAISEHELGVDVEKLGDYKEKLARRCCTDEEFRWLSVGDKADFYKMWTAKEAVMKATGLGLAMNAQSFSVLPLCDGEHCIQGKCWYLSWQQLPGYALCTACGADEAAELIFLPKCKLIV